MALYKIFNICIILIIIQACYGKAIETTTTSPTENSDANKNLTPELQLLVYSLDNFFIFGKKFADKTYEISSAILKDDSLKEHNEPEILEFKQSLSKFVQNYDINSKMDTKNWNEVNDLMTKLQNIVNAAKEKETPESKFIVDLLDKHNFEEVEQVIRKSFAVTVNDLKKKFEETKNDLDKPILEWYEKFKNLDEYEEQLNAVNKFFILMAENVLANKN